MRPLVSILCLLFPLSAWAGDDLKEAELLQKKMKYEQSLEMVERVLADPENGPEHLAKAYRIMGLCFSAMGRQDDAVLAFGKLLAIAPGFEMPKEVSPKLTALFYQAMAMSKDRKPITLVHESKILPEPGGPLGGTELSATLEADPFGMVAAVRLRFHPEGGEEQRLEQHVEGPGTVLSLKLPPGLQAKEVRYYFEAVNRHGGVLARVGSQSTPFKLRTESEVMEAVTTPQEKKKQPTILGTRVVSPPKKDYRAYKWTALGLGAACVVLGGVGTGMASHYHDQADATGDPVKLNDYNDSVGTWNGISVAGYITGGAALTAALVLFLLDSGDETENAGETEIYDASPSASASPLPDGGLIFQARLRF